MVGTHGRMMDFQHYYGGGQDLSKRKGGTRTQKSQKKLGFHDDVLHGHVQ